MSILAWKSWKLKRVSIGSNDSEIQSLVEAEDVLFKGRLMWSELHGAYVDETDYIKRADAGVQSVNGLLVTDSKGGYDAITKNESASLGLSNTRSAVQAYQLKESLERDDTRLIWMAADWNLADALTKARLDARQSMMLFLRTWIWRFRFDPAFVVSAKKAKSIDKAKHVMCDG
jgi:hypothetical protein